VSQSLLAALQNPAIYAHPVDNFQIIETHISWVLLTGSFAYKIKKPVNFGFLDFSDLTARKHFCHEEIRLNQRLTEDLYLEVVPITGSAEAPQLNGTGPVIEYAIKMRQFPQSQLLSETQARGELSRDHIDALAKQIAHFHLHAPQVPLEHPLGAPAAVIAPMRQNFEQIRPLLEDPADLLQLDALEAWTNSSYTRLKPLLAQRKAEGFIRECHGDIHLGNATQIDGRVVLFDCIEFNEPFRLIDITADSAFLVMDLEARGLQSLARRFINSWLELTGDYTALPLLNFYTAYRAMVRGKVSLFSLGHAQDEAQRAEILSQYRRYADLAESYSHIPSLYLGITHGVSAVGKSHVGMRLVEELGAIRLRSDVQRKRLFDTPSAAPAPAPAPALNAGIYDPHASAATYDHLYQLATSVLQAGFPVVIDATYLKHAQREAAWQVAEETGTPFIILDCQAPDEVIAARLIERQNAATDPSDATLEVIQAQQASREPLSDAEQLHSQLIDTDDNASLDSLIARIRTRLPGL
jgi:aminoglycoside phosphotransferase family enzyme/predicted kinase